MKSKRSPLNIVDFSGGLLTNPPQTDVDVDGKPSHTPDCLNVYAEGKALRKRFGTAHLNSASAGTLGNGIYNWVLNASQQYLMGLFDANLKQMSVSGTTWNGVWATISPDSVGGTSFSSGIMHFVTYQGTLIMTTENRDKPQRMTTSDTSYKNVDYLGSGTAPFAKYCQIWKEHVWLLNVGAGGQLSEDCNSLGNWTIQDVGTGATSQTSLGGLATFRFHGGSNNGDNSQIKRTVTGMTTAYSVEIKTYFNTLGAVTSGDYAWLDIYNGTIRFRTRWSTDGVETFNGTTWLKVGVGLVTTGNWIVWKYFITAGTATAAAVDIYQNGAPVGLQFSVANATTASNGQIQLTGNAGGSANRCDWYMDYLYILSITPRTNYYTDGVFNSWSSNSQNTNTDNPLPTIPYSHFMFEDNAPNNSVWDSGSGLNNGVANSGASTINSSVISASGKIANCFSFTSASSHFVSLSTGFINIVKTDTLGSLSMWVNPATAVTGALFAMSQATAVNSLIVSLSTGSTIRLAVTASAGSVILDVTGSTTLSTANWYHVALVQNGTLSMLVNNSVQTLSYGTQTTPGAWLSNLSTVNTGRIACLTTATNTQFFNGMIDDFRYYRTALTTSDVKSIYAEGSGNQGQPKVWQEAATIYTGTNSYAVLGNGEYAVVSQSLSSGTAIAGVASVFGGWFNVGTDQTYKLRIDDGSTLQDSAVLVGTGTWAYQNISFTPNSGATLIKAQSVFLGETNPEKTVLLLHFDGTNASTSFIDSSLYGKTLTPSGNAQISTAQSKFGSSSASFDGTGDFLTTQDNNDFNFSNGNFTIHFWIRRAATGSLQYMFGQCNNGLSAGISFISGFQSDNTILTSYTTDGTTLKQVATAGTITDTNTWHHLAYVRNTTTLTIYIDGVSSATYPISTDTIFDSTNLFGIGCPGETTTSTFNGFIDEFVVIKGTAKWTTNFTAPTRPTMTSYIDQLALIGANTNTTNDFSDRLSRSKSGTYDTWTDGGGGSADDSGHNDITTPGDVGLTGSFILQDRMYIMKAWNIYRITYTGSIPLLDIKQARSVAGTKSPRAICNIDYPNYGEIVIFLGTDRNLYLFDGFASTPLTDDVQLNNNMAQVYTNNINAQALDKVFAINHSNLGCYEIFLPMGNSTVPNFSLFYNYKTKAFWPFDNRNYLSGCVSDDGSGQRVIMVVGASNGIAYEINTEQNTSDDGTAINAYWNSFKLGVDYVLSRQDQIQIATDSVTATPTFKWRCNYETNYSTQTLSASSNQYVFDPQREANLIQFQVGDNSTGAIWKIWHIKALERGIGIGG